MLGLDLVADSIDHGLTNLVIPSVLFTEYLETGATESQFSRFERFSQRSNVQVVDVSSVVARQARELRLRVKSEGFNLKSVDAIFIATALLYRVHQMHTFDRGMLRLDGQLAIPGQIRSLIVCRPGLSSGDAIMFPGILGP
jgi:predicted nucleic acid-binding protein